MILEATALLKSYEVIFWIHKRLHFFWMHKGRHPEFSLHMSVCLLWKKSLDAVFLVQNWMQSFMGLVFLSKLNKMQSFMETKFFKAFFHANQTNVWYIRLQEEMYEGQNFHLEVKNRRKKNLPSIMNLPSPLLTISEHFRPFPTMIKSPLDQKF